MSGDQGPSHCRVSAQSAPVSAVLFVLFSKSVWVDVLGNAKALFPYSQPALFAMPIAFALALVVSRLDGSKRAASASNH